MRCPPIPLLAAALLIAGCGDGGGGEDSTPPAASSEVPALHVAIQAERDADVRSGPRETYGVIGRIPAAHVYVAFSQSGGWWKICYDGGLGYVREEDGRALPGALGVQVTVEALDVLDGAGPTGATAGRIFLSQIYFHRSPESIEGYYEIYWGGRSGLIPKSGARLVSLSADLPVLGTRSVGLPMLYYAQENSYFCGPATVQMMSAYLSGVVVPQKAAGEYMDTTAGAGTSGQRLAEGLAHYTLTPYWSSPYSRESVIRNLNGNYPVGASVDTSFLAYWGYAGAHHHSPIKGYSAGGFFIHDSSLGPDRWASDTELHNAEFYYYNKISARL